MAAGSNTLTINAANLTANDVGRTVYIPKAGAVVLGAATNALRTTITAVSGTVVTLATSATTAVMDMPVIMSPAVEFWGGANDMVLNALTIEQNSGTPVVIQDAVNVRWTGGKLHAYNNNATNFGRTSNIETDFNAALFSAAVNIDGMDIEGTAVGGLGRVLISGNPTGLNIDNIAGIQSTGLPAYALIANHQNVGFTFGSIISAARLDPAWLAGGLSNFVYNDGTSAYGALTLGPVMAYNSGPPMPVYVRPDIRTVATLPVCNTASKYNTVSVSDQNGVPTYRGALTGGGALAVLAYCNGTSWEAH
jgi:hypothetical protein